MGNGIMMCGLNGSGKSILGKALSEWLIRVDGTAAIDVNVEYIVGQMEQ